MYWFCKICDNKMIEEMKIYHLESKFHNSFVNSTIRKYVTSNPLSDNIEDTIRKYLRIHYGKCKKFRIVFLLKL